MKLCSIAWRGFALPFRNPYMTSRGCADARFGLLVFIGSDSGISGIGEASPIGPGTRGEVERVAEALKGIVPRLVGMDLQSALDASDSADLPPPLRFGLETALLDLEGRQQGCSLTELLGGRNVAVRVPVNATIASASPETACEEAEAALRAGFSSFKLKVGVGTPEQDAELVSAVRRSVGPDARIRVDANQAWTTGTALKAARLLSKHRLEYIEQPVAASDVAAMAKVRRSAGVPIAADESLCSIADLRRIIDAGAADVFILKAARLGGLRTSLRIVGEASGSGFPVVVTSSLESAVGIAANIHLSAALPAHTFAHGLATGLLFSDDLVSPPLAISNGIVSVPVSPGLGVR
ncbi:MAG: o-succinylbenzoate synthase, partial [Dehalococcoidia bacterium]|nr:o-succinylbenzoate synthase [Dehalococcoidia bacterium]